MTFTAAIFDRGTCLYTHGYIGPLNENLGRGMDLAAEVDRYEPSIEVREARIAWRQAFRTTPLDS